MSDFLQNSNSRKREHPSELEDCSFLFVSDEDDTSPNKIRCHKSVLTANSEVFERMFNGNFVESRNSENILMDDVSADDFKMFIEYLYSKDNELAKLWDLYTLQTLIYLGKKFMVDDLTELCFSTIIDSISDYSTEELINLFAFAKQMEHSELFLRIMEFCQEDPHEFLESPEILDFSVDVFFHFIRIFSTNNDFVTQLGLFDVIEKYCQEKGLITTEAEEKEAKEALNQDKVNENTLDKEENNQVDIEAQKLKEYIGKTVRLLNMKILSASGFRQNSGISEMKGFEKRFNAIRKSIDLEPSLLYKRKVKNPKKD